MPYRHTAIFNLRRSKQRGAALIVMVVIMVLGTTAFLVSSLNSASLQIARDKVTADAMAQAKEALIGYAANVQLSNSTACIPNCTRPGDLPCPDMDNDGEAEGNCGDASGSSQYKRLGRLPWKTLGLPDLRDGSGERLWYAVSNNFKNNTRTSCAVPGDTGCLNSDTVGTITIGSYDGNIINDATTGSGVAAVIIAPGDVLQRQGAASPQNRSCTIGVDCDATEKCTTTPPTLSPKCDPVKYLDIALGEDNANFADSTTNGFIQGRIKDGSGRIIVNDQLLIISQNNIMQPVQKRVVAEVRLCLEDYASNNNGRYPWAARLDDLGTNYNDDDNRYFGRVPDRLEFTHDDSNTGWPSFTYLMQDRWGTCNTDFNQTPSGWWRNWKEMVFYGVARGFRPRDNPPPSFPATCATAGNCLNINDSSAPARFVVIVAGKKLAGQARSTSGQKSVASNYLEGGNKSADQSGGYTFIQSAPSATFNDTLIYR